LLDDRPVAAAVVARRAGLEPDPGHDADAEVDVVRRVGVELHKIGLANVHTASRSLESQGGIERA
jgi:hypothetical protein